MVEAEKEEKNKQVEDGKHRMLPPLSHGWAYEGAGSGSNGRKEVVEAEKEEKNKAVEDGKHRMLPPLSHGYVMDEKVVLGSGLINTHSPTHPPIDTHLLTHPSHPTHIQMGLRRVGQRGWQRPQGGGGD